jgi:drug/metabolite transporter (DMT)-like permease
MRQTIVSGTTERRTGLALAGVTACVSGVAVFVNGYGVRRWPDATAYTTAKNLVAATVLVAAFAVVRRVLPRETRVARPVPHRPVAYLAVAVIGGSVPFVLFFEGLARASSTDAAFLHKLLVAFVAVLAVPFLHERVGGMQVAAIALLVGGQAALTGGVPDLAAGTGETMILAATVLWSIEVIVAKRYLTDVPPLPLAVARLAGGVALLLAWLVVRGDIDVLTSAPAGAWAWAAATGAILGAYAITWYAALARARAVDVSSVLVVGALITAVLDTGVRGVRAPDPIAVVLLLAGVSLVVAASVGRRPGAVAAA